MTWFETNLLIAFIALLAERFFGYPNLLYKIIRHPVVWMGVVISFFDKLFNRDNWSKERRRFGGLTMLVVLIIFTGGIAVFISFVLRSVTYGWIVEALLATSMLAQKSLHDFVRAVGDGLAKSLGKGREAVSHIVGRDPSELSESDVSKAAIESLAENTSDGVVAPLFWLIVLGLPGAVIYKAINTADSMVGYKSDKYLAFGWASAKLDDVVNLVPARLSGLLFALASFVFKMGNGQMAFRTMMRDAKHHVSPNAGWPEAAVAGALDLALGGPRSYGGRVVELPYMGDGRREFQRGDINNALGLYGIKLNIIVFVLICVGIVVFWTTR